MILKELRNGIYNDITLTLSYDELRLLNSILYFCQDDLMDDPDFLCSNDKKKAVKLNIDIFTCFQLLKHGCLDSWAIEMLTEKEKSLKETEE